MKAAAAIAVICLAGLLSGCNYMKPVMYIDLTNRSGQPMKNIEMMYPSGTFGLPELRDQQTHRRMTPRASLCAFSLTFEDTSGKAYRQSYDLGSKCPTEIAFEVEDGMRIIERVVHP